MSVFYNKRQLAVSFMLTIWSLHYIFKGKCFVRIIYRYKSWVEYFNANKVLFCSVTRMQILIGNSVGKLYIVIYCLN